MGWPSFAANTVEPSRSASFRNSLTASARQCAPSPSWVLFFRTWTRGRGWSAVRASHRDAACVHSAVNHLLEHHSHARQGALDQAGCHVYLLELLYRLSRHFRLAVTTPALP